MKAADSISSVGVKSASASSETTVNSRKRNEPDFTHLLTGAVKSIDKLSGSFLANRKTDLPDDSMDDDWLLARRMYLALKKIPDGRQKAALKHKMEGDVMNLQYEGAGIQETARSEYTTSQIPHPG